MDIEKLELLKKEIAYRASRRGTKELDTLCKPFTEKEVLNTLNERDLLLLKELLLETEDTLMHMLVEGGGLAPKYKALAGYLSLKT